MAAIEPSCDLDALFEQHGALRALMDDCEQLADDLDRGRGQFRDLAFKVAELRLAFETHNRCEERMLLPILRDLAEGGPAGVDAMVADHLREHRMILHRLDGPTVELRGTLYELRAHLVAEERAFFASRVH